MRCPQIRDLEQQLEQMEERMEEHKEEAEKAKTELAGVLKEFGIDG